MESAEYGLKMPKLFLFFVSLVCATTTAIPTTNANETSSSAILVVGGHGAGMKTELWPRSKTRCDFPDFPFNIWGAVGFNTAKGTVICGGHKENRCFIHKQNQWMPLTNMTTKRGFATATEVNNDQTLVIGGYDGNDVLKTTELISSSGTEKGKDFTEPIHSHCSFKINGTHALVTGGGHDKSDSASASTWFVDLSNTTFTPGPTMNRKRMLHGCATFRLGTKSFGIVAGGWAGGSTEIIELDEESPTWTEGPKLPTGLAGFSLLETTHGTHAMGGINTRTLGRRSEVLKLECPGDQIQSCKWKDMPEELEFPRYAHVTIPLTVASDICD